MAAAVLALAALVTSAGAAAAHIGITPAEVQPGANVTFTVRVPTEQDSPTVRVRMEFPAGVTVSRFQPKPGWQRTVERDGSGRITSATWAGGQILNGEYDEFAFIARVPAEAGTLRFRSFQTYGAGATVEWINEADPGLAPAVNVRAAAATTPTGDDHGQVATAASGASGVVGGAAGATAAPGSAGAAATARPAITAVTTAAGSQAGEVSRAGAGSDLPLIVALGSGMLSLLSLALAALALTRKPTAPGVVVSERAG